MDLSKLLGGGYRDLAQAEPKRFCVLDATKTELAIAGEILAELNTHGFFQGHRI